MINTPRYVATGILGIAIGGVSIGIVIGRWIEEKSAEKRIDEEIQKAKEFYQIKYASGRNLSQEEIEMDGETVPELQQALFEYTGSPEDALDSDVEPVELAIDWQLPERIPGRPHVISIEEFLNDEVSDKTTWYYFEDEKVFTDEEYEIIEDALVDKFVGLDCVKYFGVGTDERDIVYVRNDSYGLYEIIRETETTYDEATGGSTS